MPEAEDLGLAGRLREIRPGEERHGREGQAGLDVVGAEEDEQGAEPGLLGLNEVELDELQLRRHHFGRHLL